MRRSDTLITSVSKLVDYIRSEQYRGYDPYDSLSGPIFKLGLIKRSRILRFGFQQVMKRSPVNLRPFFGIRKGLNPVTLGLAAQAYSYLERLFGTAETRYDIELHNCIRGLESLASQGFSGSCWGYDFEWESRYASLPAYYPTVVATGFVANALYENYSRKPDEHLRSLIEGAACFALKDLNRTYEGETFCFSYSPKDHQVVYNATMKGARILAQASAITGHPAYIEEARNTVAFVVNHQRTDGSWSYSLNDRREWIDNFHTAYILDCLDEYIRLSKGSEFEENLKRGVRFYVDNFFEKGTIPKYYNNRTYPIDSTAVAQSIITLCRFGFLDIATRVAEWAINNMQDSKGYFYYQKRPGHLNRISYMRWSNAWMLVGLSKLLVCGNENRLV